MKFGQWLGFISLILALGVLWEIRQLLLLVFTAIVIATALNRLVRHIQQFGIKRQVAVVITLSLGVLLALLFVLLVVPPFIDQFLELLDRVPIAFNRLRLELMALEQKLPPSLPPPPSFNELLAQLEPLSAIAFFQNSLGTLLNSIGTLLQLLLILVLTLMMLANPLQYRQALLKLLPSFYRRRADYILSESEVALGNWLGGMAINCTFIGISSGLGLLFFQVKLVLVHALIAGVFNFIPNIGPAASAIFPVAIALLDAPWKVAAVLIWYVFIQNVESYWLSPMVMASKVSLLPAVTLTSQIFFARSFGLLGLILALPLAVVAKTWIEEVLLNDILDRWIHPENFSTPAPSSPPGLGK